MSWDSKVLWTEGLFLQPQHFQQADRYTEALVAGLARRVHPYLWGVGSLDIDTDALKVGQFAVRSASGLTEDGAVFRIPDADPHPPALDVPGGVHDCIVYLTVPARREGAAEVDLSGAELSGARFRPAEQDVTDTMSAAGSGVTLGVGKLRLQFALEVDDLADRLAIPIARILEVKSDREIVLDGAFVPSCLDIRASSVLSGFLRELEGLLTHRMTALSGRLTQAGSAKVVVETQDVMLLAVVNRALVFFRHLGSIENVHPERLYSELLRLAGELSTYMAAQRHPAQMASYTHHDLTTCYAKLMRELRQYLSAVLDQTAVSIPLEPRQYGISVGVIADRKLIGNSGFVLAVNADIAPEKISRHFAGQAKIGPVEEIRQLVNSALPGIPLTPLPVAPRQIPYQSGNVYFELDAASPYWGKMTTSGGVAVHVSGDYPGLGMELWAIRRG